MKRMIVLAALAMLGGCGDEKAAQQSVLEVLKDPDSAKFGEFYYNPETKKGCLGVNAKNGMGGYTGEQQAFLEKKDGGWKTLGLDEISLAGCRSEADRKD
ncbi:hypothetical protein [Novosphingobium sp. MMS21-SN21R]|uniref:hypothetical protein n=1 Tax=Novosphingobium sp. MMS21-SN21R TaxID=2969298 RepID=UPI002883A448|nr:hypothetical protein [Novosphingobium sp. MMS21-SN21R]MDT0507443.1 hypothetical protein [Novosphingobium sp. MMS21-SN21R]